VAEENTVSEQMANMGIIHIVLFFYIGRNAPLLFKSL